MTELLKDITGPLEETRAALQAEIAARQRAERLQSVLYRLASAAASVEDMQEFYRTIHAAVGELMYANNFYVVLYDEARQMINFPFYLDEVDDDLPDPHAWHAMGTGEAKGLTAYVLRTGRPALLTRKRVEELIDQGEIQSLGAPPVDWVGVPLQTADRTVGVLVVQSYSPDIRYSQQDLDLLTFVGQHVASALERAKLQTETRQRMAELSIINSIGQALARQLDFQAIVDLVGDNIREIFQADTAYIAFHDRQADLIRFPYYFERGHRHSLPDLAWGEGLTSQVIRSRQPLLIHTTQDQRRLAADEVASPEDERDLNESYLGVPILVGDEAVGVVSVQSYQPHTYDEGDVRLLSTVTANMGVALENANLFLETKRLLEESQQRNAELAVINSVSRALSTKLDLDALIELVGEQMRQTFKADIVYVALHDRQSDLIHFPYVYGEVLSPMRFGEGLTSRILESGQPLLINQDVEGRHAALGMQQIGVLVKSYLGVPIVAGNEAIGVISVQSATQEGRFDEADVRLLGTIAANVGAAIQNARLYRETQRRASEMAALAEIGRDISATLDPSSLLERITCHAQELLRARDVVLRLRESDGRLPAVVALGKYAEIYKSRQVRLGHGLTGHIAQSGRAEIVNAPLGDPRVTRVAGTEQDEENEAMLLAPLLAGDQVIGIMVAWRDKSVGGPFTQSDLDFAVGLSRQAAIAIENARLYTAAQEAKAAAEAANQAKSAFLSTVSHELRTPLTSVLGFAKISQQSLQNKIFPYIQTDDRKVQREIRHVTENLDIIVSEGERLTTLINNVLDLAKIEAGKVEWKMQPLAMSTVIERATTATAALFEKKGLALIKEVADDLPAVVGDQDKLIQVVVNLISNAVKFTQQGAVTCRVQQPAGGCELVVSVMDTGMGIAPEDQPKVFEKFKQVGDTLTDKPQGTGLGLSICKEIVEHHGGRIWLESEPGRGSTFSFSLPLSPVPPETGQPASPVDLPTLIKQLKAHVVAATPNPAGAQKSILVVDDEAPIRKLLGQELGEAGYRVREARDGQEALLQIRQEKPDLVILDVLMPKMNGFHVAALLKSDPQTMDIPIIILTIVEDKERGYRLGVDRYLTKPINTQALFDEIEELLARSASPRHVLIVDKDATTLQALAEVLQEKGYCASTAGDGATFVEQAVSAQPDVILAQAAFLDQGNLVRTLRLEQGLENVVILFYQ
jgi:signal transduction histidine kinase/DNA-binding response OmpR family regulator/putative methionine-R-sulfoxide reductase with GAF domain